ncbi:hypothetical protein H8356DRAFT_1436307 [Neocallimastix lanati (nom. inval.)]|nr:hypothetical protein H8356DRAFT_1438338 [Neocallimastix sp. JGI-2020a]KAG4081776.1 hypothetical protein H8356DRAFT_1438341 [Neocallimastix sp. JGI-2020a]KAG4081883.1 hypothetical protein H8356DRAFT_1438203 [Neocallimastix sp. JGI-2020a]KAG4081885.1 hypothetical protein H8356DRAFT_1438205 [Neocallimastix sp. JGI-2020a]KAG4081888.1 hypothetical protein H8356DRAFT_1438208 [Neocallimastix sp. JGI-2020a]
MEQSNRKTKTKLKIRYNKKARNESLKQQDPHWSNGRVGLRRHVKAVIYS